jgi:flagellar basal-body rod protein FlgG
MDDQGRLVNGDGHLMIPVITIPNGVDINRITIGADGTIQGQPSGTDQVPTNLGQIQISTFPNPSGLSNEGSNLFATTAASGPPTASNPGVLGYGTVRSGMLEGANVEVVTELISLISAQRAYEINSRAIRAGDEMLSTSIDIVR